MGRVRPNIVKKAARSIVEKYFGRLTFDFDSNKKVTEEIAVLPSKRIRNKISGYVTHLMKRIQRGPVRGVSLKLQEEERERRMDFIPEKSAIDTDLITIDADTKSMLEALDFGNLANLDVQPVSAFQERRPYGGDRERGERKQQA